MVEMAVTTGTIRRAKLQSNFHHQQTNTQLFTGRMPFLSPNQQCQSTHGKPEVKELSWLTPNEPFSELNGHHRDMQAINFLSLSPLSICLYDLLAFSNIQTIFINKMQV